MELKRRSILSFCCICTALNGHVIAMVLQCYMSRARDAPMEKPTSTSAMYVCTALNGHVSKGAITFHVPRNQCTNGKPDCDRCNINRAPLPHKLTLDSVANAVILSSPIHPSQPVRRLFQRKDLLRILLHATVSGPQLQCFVRRLKVRAKVGGVVPAKQNLKFGELLSIAVGDRDFNLNGALDIADRTLDAFGESGADLAGVEHFVSEGDSVGRIKRQRCLRIRWEMTCGLTDARTISSDHL